LLTSSAPLSRLPPQVSRIDLGLLDELVDLDGPRRFQHYLLQFLLGNLHEGLLVQHVGLGDVFVRDFLAGIGVDLGVFDAVAGFPVQLVECVSA
jgi:hypothetical protein